MNPFTWWSVPYRFTKSVCAVSSCELNVQSESEHCLRG